MIPAQHDCPLRQAVGDAPKETFVLYFLHMTRTFKTFLLWLLMALVPLQAGAAAMGMSCGAAHQQSMSVALPAPAGHDEHGSGMDHQHDTTGEAAMVADTALSEASMTSEGLTHSSCSACSDFCIGAFAPPPALAAIPTFNGAESVVISHAALVVGFVPDGLKRPPRSISA